jgi:hypothetical protein
VVVIATGAQESAVGAELGHQREPDHVAVEGDRLRDLRHLEVHMSHDGGGWQSVEPLGERVLELV